MSQPSGSQRSQSPDLLAEFLGSPAPPESPGDPELLPGSPGPSSERAPDVHSTATESDRSAGALLVQAWLTRTISENNTNDAENIPSTSQSAADESTRDSFASTAALTETENSNSAFVASDTEEPPPKLRKIVSAQSPQTPKRPKSPEDGDGETCPICLDSWGNSGDHRLVALKCGHLFGDKCVRRWLAAQPPKARSCPTCKGPAHSRDLRHIYARRLVAADTSQLAALQARVDALQADKSRAELELQKCKIAHRACSMQLEVVRSLMKSQADRERPQRTAWRFALDKNLELSRDGGCRVLAYDSRTYELYVSQKSTNALFPGYGVRRVSCLDYRPGQFVLLHPKAVRDLRYSAARGLLLSVGLDGAARVLERGVPGLTVRAGAPLWSCSWDYLRGHEFYVGGAGGLVQRYDARNPSACLQTLSAPDDLSPVVALESTEFGLLACQLNSCRVWSGAGAEEARPLPVEGGFTCLRYDEESRRAAVAARGAGGRARLAVCRLRAGAAELEDTFPGSARSSVLARVCWVRAAGAGWLAAPAEGEAALVLHGLDGARSASLPAADTALDLHSMQLNGSTLLAALSDCRLRVYRAVPTNL